ncbi:MAG TPA: trypsin-like peptidase domain-containing protein [Ktedonobacteraceae bacterium]|nr:trypsin-like peptidase domain-containing protein [Ktedonobacteraceae bacterium]
MLHPYDHSTEPFQSENAQPPQPGYMNFPFQAEDEPLQQPGTMASQVEDAQSPQPGSMAYPFQVEDAQSPQPGSIAYPFQVADAQSPQPGSIAYPFQVEDAQSPQPGSMAYPPAAPPPDPGDKVTRGRPSRGWRTASIAALTLMLAVVFGVGLFSGWVYGRNSVATSTTPALQQGSNPTVSVPQLTSNNIQAVQEAVVQKVSPSVVQVNVQTSQGAGIGSGVIIDKRGYIVTNDHVVAGAQQIQVVLYDGTKLNAQLVGTDATDDLAVIKINPPSNLAVATLGNSSQLKVGQNVLAIGNPLGITQTVTNGIVSALNRTVSEGQGSNAIIPDAIQTDAAINPGNSGGALVDLQGNVIGIPTLNAIDPEFNTPASGVGFAIPSNRVNFIATQLIQYGKVIHTGRAGLGVSVESVNSYLAALNNLPVQQGALIAGLQSGGPAQHAGLQVGDVIVQINNTQVVDTSSLGDALAQYNIGETVAVHVYRGNQQLTINVKLGELSAQP